MKRLRTTTGYAGGYACRDCAERYNERHRGTCPRAGRLAAGDTPPLVVMDDCDYYPPPPVPIITIEAPGVRYAVRADTPGYACQIARLL